MPDNFFVTAKRMNDSAQTLHEQHHHHIACYLAGYVAECYLKLLVEKEPTITTSIAGRGGYGHNVRQMNIDLNHAISSGASIGGLGGYLIDLSIDCPNIYGGWHPLKRYDDSAGWNNSITSDYFQNERKKCFEMIAKMYIDNFIP